MLWLGCDDRAAAQGANEWCITAPSSPNRNPNRNRKRNPNPNPNPKLVVGVAGIP